MRTAAGYIGVAVITAALTWWAATMRPEPLPAAPAVSPDTPIELTPEEQISVGIYQNVNRSVVNITTRSVVNNDDLGLSGPEISTGTGSGSVLDHKGHIVTNFHVVEGARQINVTLFDGSIHEASLVGGDPNNDLAVVKIDAPKDKLFPITWGDSNRLLVGMRVYAIGNPFGLDRTMTTGIVSSLNRSLETRNHRTVKGVIQTDAAINPGNSGGPLLNRQGYMIGITTAIFSRVGQSSGIGMAIPSNAAKRVVEEIIRSGKVSHGDAGIVSVYQTDKGLLVAKLDADGPAAHAGLRGPQVRTVSRGGQQYRYLDRSKADLIVGVNGQPVKTLDDLLTAIEAHRPGEKIALQVEREGKRMDVAIELAEGGD
jgi:S1-C subfamily serine protease